MKETFVVLLDEAFEKSSDTSIAASAASGLASRQQLFNPSVETHEVSNTAQATRLHNELASNPKLRAVAPSIPLSLHEPAARDVEAEPSTSRTWGLEATGVDNSPFDGTGVVVAVLDTGIDANHIAFDGVDLVQRDFTGEGDGDENGHGTHCAATLFGQNVGSLRIGVANNVDRAVIGKVLGSQGGSSEGIASAILWAIEMGANIISMSLGFNYPAMVTDLVGEGFPEDLATSKALEAYRQNIDLFSALARLGPSGLGKGTVIVAAAGNHSRRNENPEFKIAAEPPAVAEGVISVGAVGKSENGLSVAPFSNTLPRVVGPGVAVRSARAGGGISAMSGTSMAVPHVAGIAALWAQKLMEETGGGLNSRELESRIVGTSAKSPLTKPIDHADVGAGLVMAPQG